MKDELVDKTALVTSVLDQKAAEKDTIGDEGAKADKNLAESFSRAGGKIRAIMERIDNRINILDEFAEEFRRDKGRYPSPEEQNAEMEKRGFRKDGDRTI
jgi:hypothetical protein